MSEPHHTSSVTCKIRDRITLAKEEYTNVLCSCTQKRGTECIQAEETGLLCCITSIQIFAVVTKARESIFPFPQIRILSAHFCIASIGHLFVQLILI